MKLDVEYEGMDWVNLTQPSHILMLHAVANKVTYLHTPQ
jgi:hypothetical protein